MTKSRLAIIFFVFVMLFAGKDKIEACSVFKVTAEDGTIISGRTMEFGHDMGYAMIVVPRGKSNEAR